RDLRDIGQVAGDVLLPLVRRVPVEHDLPLAGHDAHDHAGQGGLAGAVGTDESHSASGGDGKAHVPERGGLAETLPYVVQLDAHAHGMLSTRISLMIGCRSVRMLLGWNSGRMWLTASTSDKAGAPRKKPRSGKRLTSWLDRLRSS